MGGGGLCGLLGHPLKLLGFRTFYEYYKYQHGYHTDCFFFNFLHFFFYILKSDKKLFCTESYYKMVKKFFTLKSDQKCFHDKKFEILQEIYC